MEGTVKSGHPLDTTLYNSCRSYHYYRHITQGYDTRCLIAGDDLVILVHESHAEKVFS